MKMFYKIYVGFTLVALGVFISNVIKGNVKLSLISLIIAMCIWLLAIILKPRPARSQEEIDYNELIISTALGLLFLIGIGSMVTLFLFV
jgi:hypothetical protein